MPKPSRRPPLSARRFPAKSLEQREEPPELPAVEAPPELETVSPKRPGWTRELIVGLVSGAVVAAGSMLGQAALDDQRSQQEERLENLRYVRERSSEVKTSRPFRGMDLEGQNLAGLELNGADLAEAKMKGADLTHTELSEASFIGADLSGATFSSAELSDSFLSYANLQGAKLTKADIRSADLEGIDLRNADLSGSTLSESLLANARLDGAALKDARLDAVLWMNDPSKTVCYDSRTTWPSDYLPPVMDQEYCRER